MSYILPNLRLLSKLGLNRLGKDEICTTLIVPIGPIR